VPEELATMPTEKEEEEGEDKVLAPLVKGEDAEDENVAFASCVAKELEVGTPRQNLFDFVLTSSSFLLESDFLDADPSYWCATVSPKDLCVTFYNRWYDKEAGRERFQVCEWNVETGECGPREPCG
jgi:predicted urease superfamily metal-dependent hydrolase